MPWWTLHCITQEAGIVSPCQRTYEQTRTEGLMRVDAIGAYSGRSKFMGWTGTQSSASSCFRVNAKPAEKVITQAVFELTGGAGKAAMAFWRFLAEIEFPGKGRDGKCDDPRIMRRRALWIAHERKVHSFAMARARYHVMVRKRDLIRARRAGKKAAGKVGVSSIDADPLPRGVGDVFDIPGRGAGHMAPDGACGGGG